ncbi:MAG TPA: polysaccharide deacetylase family protein [Bacillota bacterium]|nr:polysaccharide deacetylase family protein [Bacillota bacterium]
MKHRTLLHITIGILISLMVVIVRPQAVDSLLQSKWLGEVALPRYTDGSERQSRTPESIDLVSLFPDIVVRQWSPETKKIALTFDDGPDDVYTPRILDVLAKYNVRATFFLIGNAAEKHRDIVQRIHREGHEIGNHTYYHSNLSRMAPWQILLDLGKARKVFSDITGEDVLVVRPPYGALDPPAVKAIGDEGYNIVLWTVDSLDWWGLSKEEVIQNVIPRVERGVIVLHHSSGGPDEDLTGSVEALPEIIETLQSQGYSFHTASEILEEIRAQNEMKKKAEEAARESAIRS